MNNNKNKQVIFSIIGIAILCIAVVGVTFAFFNYTRTGNTNTVQAGRIVFNTTQGDAINLSNAFPITSAQASTDTTNTKTLQIAVSGDTSYGGGIEYLVTATDVHMTTTTGKTVPVTIEVSVTGNNSKTLGTSDDDYYTNRGGNTSMYKVEYNGKLKNDGHILVGYIAPDITQTGVDGIINIKAYFNSDDVLISDTYNDGNPPTDKKGTSVILGEGKTVLTTDEWNSLTGNNALSFKIKVEAREGTWVEQQATAENCFTYTTNNNEVTITGYDVSCGGTDVVIPKTINGLPVTTIYGNENNYELGAFTRKGITSVVIPNSVKKIGFSSFGANNLSNTLIIPNSVEVIGQYAFDQNQITDLIIPNSVTEIGDFPFRNNNKLSNIYIDVKNIPYALFAGLGGIETVTFGEHVESIGADAFSSNNILSLEIPNNITFIDHRAFSNNKNLANIKIYSKSLNTYNDIFYYCTATKNLYINMSNIPPSLLSGNNISNLTIGPDVKTIGQYSFAGNSISAVTIPSTVEQMYCSAFASNSPNGNEIVITYENPSFTCTN